MAQFIKINNTFINVNNLTSVSQHSDTFQPQQGEPRRKYKSKLSFSSTPAFHGILVKEFAEDIINDITHGASIIECHPHESDYYNENVTPEFIHSLEINK